MIKGLYETHIHVKDLSRSTAFYQSVLGLEQCFYDANRKVAFFWIGAPKKFMLGIWEKEAKDIQSSHFAFESDAEWIINKSVAFLKKNGLHPFNFLKNGIEEPMVFAWMPAISIYFNDPDGHVLEFISILEGKANPQLGIVSYKQWKDSNLTS
jgi:lactoylglutathione lyase